VYRAADRGAGRLSHDDSRWITQLHSCNLAMYFSCGAERRTPFFHKIPWNSSVQQVRNSPAAVHRFFMQTWRQVWNLSTLVKF